MDEQVFKNLIETYDLIGDGPPEKYLCISNAAAQAPEGMFVEIGFRNGTGALSMIEGRTPSNGDLFIGIDPYGNIPFKIGAVTRKYDYTNEKRKKTLVNFYRYLDNLNPIRNFLFLNFESSEVFDRFEDGIPDYFSGERVIRTDYSLAHLDGQHDTENVLAEVEFFIPRIQTGGYILIDDVTQNWFDMELIESTLFDGGFVKDDLSVKDKWVYKK